MFVSLALTLLVFCLKHVVTCFACLCSFVYLLAFVAAMLLCVQCSCFVLFLYGLSSIGACVMLFGFSRYSLFVVCS